MNGKTDYTLALKAKWEMIVAQRRDDRHRLSWLRPGARNLSVSFSKYDGAALRVIRVTHGVGRPI